MCTVYALCTALSSALDGSLDALEMKINCVEIEGFPSMETRASIFHNVIIEFFFVQVCYRSLTLCV